MITLNDKWKLACDPDNKGREEKWFNTVRRGAETARVPGIIQEVFPDYHGVAWYWTSFRLPREAAKTERVLLRFGAVDYLAEVWVNGILVGEHEGGETPFTLDVTDAIHDEADNLLAVRVLNPTDEPIDGIKLSETPHFNKRAQGYQPGASYDYGGILLPVKLRMAPAARIEDIFVQSCLKTGNVDVAITIRNDGSGLARGTLELTISAFVEYEPIRRIEAPVNAKQGCSTHEIRIKLTQPHPWSIDDPFLYMANVRLTGAGARKSEFADSSSVRFGFRDFRVKDGFFYLNGKRLFLKSTHTGNHFPIGQTVPHNPDFMRRDLIYAKACGFNMVRFIAGVAWPEQLDCCDEIGLMVYEENMAGWLLEDSPKMAERFDRSTREMILRDRNHPSVTIWGLLNETGDNPVFRNAVKSLKWIRDLDDTRLILLGSGRWDCRPSIGSVSNPHSRRWEHQWGVEKPGAKSMPDSWTTLAGGYFENAGDAHTYPAVPLTETFKSFLRSLGKDTKPVFLSEFGTGSLFNVVDEYRKYEEVGARKDLPDMALIGSMRDKLAADWKRYDMDETYTFLEDFLRDSYRLHIRERRLNFDLVRSNPNLCGYNITGMLDHGITGEGLWTFWREWKPGIADALRDGWAPLRWCLFVTPEHGYSGRSIRLEAVLANEGILTHGSYPVCFRVTGPDGLAWERWVKVRMPKAKRGKHEPLATPVLLEDVKISGPAGEYTFSASLEQGGAPMGDRKQFRLTAASSLPDSKCTVTVWGISKHVIKWLNRHGVTCRAFEDGVSRKPETIIVGKPARAGFKEWNELLNRVARGGTVVFLTPEAFKRGKETTARLPLSNKGTCNAFNDWLYHKECVAKRHPVFKGLQAGGIMDWSCYDQIVPHAMFEGLDTPDETIAVAFATGYSCPGGYASGVLMGAYRFHKGRMILNTLRILEHINVHPNADRLLLNLIAYTQQIQNKRLFALPVDFETKLQK